MISLALYISLRWWICATCYYKVYVDINATTSKKISVRWEQRKLSLIAKYLGVTLNFLYMWEKASEWKQLRDGCPFQLVRDSTTHEQTHLDFVNQHRFHIRKEQILLFKNWLYRNEIQSATKFQRTLTLLTAKIFSAELAGVVYSKKKFTVIIFRNVVTVKVENENLREL